MAHSKSKIVKNQPLKESKEAYTKEDPDSIYALHPSWSFCRADNGGNWAFSKDVINNDFWDSLLPRMSGFETMTWGDILLRAKKENHTISVEYLNPIAQKRLTEINLSLDAVVSLRIDGTHRLYGFMSAATFVLLWYDKDHGDNLTCVCRSVQRHT